MHRKLRVQDIIELIMGSVILGFPIAVTEEVWQISEQLPLGRSLFIVVCSVSVLAFFTYYLFYKPSLKGYWPEFLIRMTVAYLVTFLVSALILATIDQLPLVAEPVVALKRTIIVTLPASFSATVVDSLQ